MTKSYVWVLAAILTAVGTLMFLYKWLVLGFPVYERQEIPAWTVETTIRFDSGPGSIKVNLQIPNLTPGFGKLDHYSVSKNFGFGVNYAGGGREAEWTVRRADGEQTLFYRIVVYEDKGSQQSDTTPPFPIPPLINEPLRTAVEVLVAEVRDHSADPASFTAELLRLVNNPSPNSNIELILAGAQSSSDFVQMMTTILEFARIPARMIRGLVLQEQQREMMPVPWLEIHDGAAQKNYLDAMAIAEKRADIAQSTLFDFSLYSLPIQTQSVYSVILMMPIGALVMVLMRNVVGIDAFGTFMPVLIALAFRETQLFWGIVLFVLLVAMGLSIRFLLERLRLLLVPRLASVLIVVVLLMMLVSILSHKLGMETGLSVALFPMVIIAMTIERMSVLWEERGPGDAMRAGIGSLVVAIVAYLAMGMDWLEHLVFAFPELLLLVLAIVIILGRYTGYRFTELGRFKAIGRD